ncbi:hypothetical protein [Saccharopolyspora phatthalungensis]|uniref:Uncharacterized protein n=1 Tax=Saccharopolyspora phatthalungensis TaxID=664693 RepID=A0A840Q8J4_9PSEU|nr:hypothetical protein [Saccharopolyspora phatthalungensis]MBB5154939.1 hypothetical protein [Saccharopolyspora phatthalungensis]
MATASAMDAEVRAYLEAAPPEVLRCRRWNHAWDPTHDGFLVRNKGRSDECWSTELECMRCHSGAVDRFEPWTMVKIGEREYDYVDGYLQEGVTVTKQDVRQFFAEQQMGRRRQVRGKRKMRTRKPTAKAA